MKNTNHILRRYTTFIEVEKPVEDVFNHLIYDVAKFWPEDFEGESSKLNDEFIFTSGEGSHYSKNKVVELVPNEKIVWLVTESIRKTDNFDWTGTKMIFELTLKGKHTLLEFTYDGVILEDEYDRLVQICDVVIKEMLYKYLIN
ncbi:MAG TPA: SRPBCC domain-containing protein [Mucilaginibacter sp.]|nr:SRPBCC domain-containing protein [Mucilaginibacter sp.]